MDGADDASLVEAARSGDRQALEALLRRHQPRVYALCRRMTGNDADALDATQEALISITRGLPRFDGRSAFTTWLHRVATNACLDELRRRGRRPEPVEPDGVRPLTTADRSIDEAVADRISIDSALGSLSPDHRAVIVLRDHLGMEYGEIARVLDLRVGTVKSRIARARAALASYLGNPSADDGVQGSAP